MKCALGTLPVVVVCFVAGLVGCSKRETPAPVSDVQPSKPDPVAAPPKPEAEATGTVKFEFRDLEGADAMVVLDGNEYRLAELALAAGDHELDLKSALPNCSIHK